MGKFPLDLARYFSQYFFWNKKKFTEQQKHKFLSWPYLDKRPCCLPLAPNHREQHTPIGSYNSFQENYLANSLVFTRGQRGEREVNEGKKGQQ